MPDNTDTPCARWASSICSPLGWGQWWGGGRWVLVGGPNLPILRPTGPLTGLFWPSVGGGPAKAEPTPLPMQDGRRKRLRPAEGTKQRTAPRFGRAEGVGGNKRGPSRNKNRPSHPTQKRNTAPLRRALRLGGEQGGTGRIDGPQAASTAQNGPLRACAAPRPPCRAGVFAPRRGRFGGIFFFFAGPPLAAYAPRENFGKFLSALTGRRFFLFVCFGGKT